MDDDNPLASAVCIAFATSRTFTTDSKRWSELRIYRTEDRRYGAVLFGCSDIPGEVTRARMYAPMAARALVDALLDPEQTRFRHVPQFLLDAIADATKRDSSFRHDTAQALILQVYGSDVPRPDSLVFTLERRFERPIRFCGRVIGYAEHPQRVARPAVTTIYAVDDGAFAVAFKHRHKPWTYAFVGLSAPRVVSALSINGAYTGASIKALKMAIRSDTRFAESLTIHDVRRLPLQRPAIEASARRRVF